MTKIIIEVHMYVFFVDYLHAVEQSEFSSDEDAIEHAKVLEKRYGKKVIVARWLETNG